jgi:threonine synthase
MGLELAEQFGPLLRVNGPVLPDAIIYPTGGGTGLIGMWKAFDELRRLGQPVAAHPVGGGVGPRMYAVQAEGCAPIVAAFERGERHAQPFPNASTAASGLRVPATIGDFMILDAVRESGGAAVAGAESEIAFWMKCAAQMDGICLCPEAAVALSGLRRLAADGRIRPHEHVLLFNTASALKYLEVLESQQFIPG